MATTDETKRTEPVQVRDHLVDVLRRDLVGAEPDEVLAVAPSRWYLTGFLVPREAPIEVRQDPEPDEGLASGGDDDGDDAAPPEVAPARKAFFPSSMGLSVLVPAATRALSVRATWGEYVREEGSVRPAPEGAGPESQVAARPQERWRRSPREGAATIAIPAAGKVTHSLAKGVNVVVSVRRVPGGAGVEKGAREAQLVAGFEAWKKRRQAKKASFPGVTYVMLHSLSYLLLTAVSLECGYAASSIRERVYLDGDRCGILLFTGTPDAEGTLGSLVQVGKKLGHHLEAALEPSSSRGPAGRSSSRATASGAG